MGDDWRYGRITAVGTTSPPNRPSRPETPTLLAPREMPKRGKAGSETGRIALLHALAHIEFNAVDLACDLIARFASPDLPRPFFDDWVVVAKEEAIHFTLISERLCSLGSSYGALPAHDGLWEAAIETRHDLLARLAIVPLVLEARGLDVTPMMIKNLEAAGDKHSVAILQRIYKDEIGHVAAGERWFTWMCHEQALDPTEAYHRLVRRYFRGRLKPPFNREARKSAGLEPGFYEPLSID
jgi:uncharacterized ferritin-like protein (DUF455 family)